MKISHTNVSISAFSAVHVVVGALVLFPALLFASPLLRCQINQGDNEQILDFVPSTDPYKSESIKINDRFRFKAVVVGNAEIVDYIKIYVYAEKKRQPSLLNEAVFIAPVTAPYPTYYSLTGKIFVYEPELERELQYGCALLEVAQ